MTVEPDELPDLPAAVEVALYRIAAEGIHNAARHSGGRHCTVVIEVIGDRVRLTVGDDGRGLPDPLVEGVGTAAMRERAEELGGTVSLANGADGHALVTTCIPLGTGIRS